MMKLPVQRLAYVVRVCIIILLAINLLALVLMPSAVSLSYNTKTGQWLGLEEGVRFVLKEGSLVSHWLLSWGWIFKEFYTASLAVFLWACGICSFILLWQAKRVVESVLTGETLSFANAANMKRAAFCCMGISAAALIRMLWSVLFYHSAVPMVSYNTLFIPVFLVAGLFCLVLSALFRQAAEVKAENDLTI